MPGQKQEKSWTKPGTKGWRFQVALWYNELPTVKASADLVGFLDDDRSPFVKTGNHSLKGVFA